MIEDDMLFLAGGGEMGALIRAYDWSATSIGVPKQWPQNLRSTLSIILNSRFPMFIFWGEELLCFYNDAYRPSMGNDGKHPHALGKPAQKVWEEIWPVIKPLIDRVMSGGGATWSEDQLIPIYRNKKLEDVYWTFGYSPITDDQGKPEAVLVICTETTEKVENLAKLEESKRELQFAIDAAELGTFDYNPITDKFTANTRVREWFGLPSSGELDLSQVLSIIAEKDRQRTVDAIKSALVFESGGNYDIEYTIVNAHNGREMIVRAKGGTWYNENKVAYRLNGTVQDITEQKLYEKELEEREQNFRLLADFMPQFVWTSDAAGNLNYFNLAVHAYADLTPEEIKIGGWLQIVHPEDKEENVRLWEESIKTGKVFLFEHRFRRYDGEYRWQLSRAIPQKDTDGKTIKWIGTSTDIQDQKVFSSELERQVNERTKELEQKNIDLKKMNDQLQSFAYVSSHDLQEPLRKIQTFASRIMEKEVANLSDQGKNYFTRMQNAANRMQTLIDDLLVYSRTDSTERIFEDVSIAKVVDMVVDDYLEALNGVDAIIHKTELGNVNAIAFQMHQLFENLISNSIKFSSPERALVISVKSDLLLNGKHQVYGLADDKSYCHLSYSDNGIGFEPAFNEKVFEIFQRLHTLKEYKGTGIGLAIVKKIVENHGGIITASGELDKGATFDLYLPA